LLEKGMDASMMRHQVISDNIANADTPGFKRSSITFESQLRRALDSEKAMKECPQAYLTSKKHIPFCKPLDYRNVRSKIHVDFDTNYRNDKNNVDIEKEVSDAVVNTMRYRALAERVKGNFKMLNQVLN
ncbi:MAG: flagellar basal body rod protein FlgB, partial [Spirochaetes bacterium]|nr:flagellar basal body rod protein FlgB [Spirochaetota bacterium]